METLKERLKDHEGFRAEDFSKKDEFDLLLACILGEAEGEPLFGKLAVACVVRNRVLDKRWPNTYKGALLQAKQFSCFLPQHFRPEIFKHNYSEPWWRECKFAAFGVYYNWIQDVTHGANHYYAISIDPPYWTEGRHPVFRMGEHWFYKL